MCVYIDSRFLAISYIAAIDSNWKNVRSVMWPNCGLIGVLQIFLLLITPTCKLRMTRKVTSCLRTCADSQYRDKDIRLVAGSFQWEGRVEIYLSGKWGTITDSDWTSDDAQVICRKLGHFKPGAKVTQSC